MGDVPVVRGKVFLVGAGPGDPELLTVKGARLLSEADAVVYDALVDPIIMDHVSADAERWFAGKRGGEHYLPQEKINELLVELAGRLEVVVRLKGGDPFLFGRGAEEAEYLSHRDVPVEVVPGVTSAIAVPECIGIPLTHRDHASMTIIATGHRRIDSYNRSHIDWGQLGALDATLSILMGAKRLPKIVEGLLAGGRSPETEVAMIQWGTTERERFVVATLGTIVDVASRAELGPPAVLVVGDVVSVRRRLGFSDD